MTHTVTQPITSKHWRELKVKALTTTMDYRPQALSLLDLLQHLWRRAEHCFTYAGHLMLHPTSNQYWCLYPTSNHHSHNTENVFKRPVLPRWQLQREACFGTKMPFLPTLVMTVTHVENWKSTVDHYPDHYIESKHTAIQWLLVSKCLSMTAYRDTPDLTSSHPAGASGR